MSKFIQCGNRLISVNQIESVRVREFGFGGERHKFEITTKNICISIDCKKSETAEEYFDMFCEFINQDIVPFISFPEGDVISFKGIS